MDDRVFAFALVLAMSGAVVPPVADGGTTHHGLSPLRARDTACPPSPGGSGILPDGDFSEATDPGAGFITLGKGTVFAPGWIVKRRDIDFIGHYWTPPNGVCSVDLDGDLAVGAIQHARFATTMGASYTLTFLFSGNGDCAPTVKTMRVRVGGTTQTFTWDITGGNDAQNGDFATVSVPFNAVKPQSNLSFNSDDPPGSGCGPVVAAITVTPSSPRSPLHAEPRAFGF